MRIRAAVLCAVAVVAAAAAPAGAKAYCRLAKEAPGDRDFRGAARGPSGYGPWDLKSLDVATNATHLTGVLRLGNLTNPSPAAAQEGGTYLLAFSVDPERHYSLVARIGGGYDSFELYQDGDGWIAPEDERPPNGVEVYPPSKRIASARGVVDKQRNEIRMTVPLTAFGRGVVRPGRKLARFGANSASTTVQMDESLPPNWRFVLSQHEDAISARKWESYPVGAPSCVRVGR